MPTSRAFFVAAALFALASFNLAACAVDEGDEELTDDELAAGAPEESLPLESTGPVATALSCPGGTHHHVVDWPVTGLRTVPCGSVWVDISGGTEVCMENAPATACGGQGWARVFVGGQWWWARMEAFDGH